MFKLVVLSALVAIVAAKPSGLLGYSAIAAPAIAVPAAVSHQYRSDVISKPVVATYAATPIVEKVVAAPVVAAAPAVVAAPVALSAAVTHQSRVDYHHPTVAVAAAPVAYAAAAPLAYAAHVPAVHAW